MLYLLFSLDIFFDIEGFPRIDRPFEYLHGLYYKDKGKLKFKALWAKNYDKESEKSKKESQALSCSKLY